MAKLLWIHEDEYHKDPCDTPSLSNSIAKVLVEETPRHAWLKHPRLGGASDDEGTSDDEGKFDMGKACHAYLLEGVNKIVIVDEDSWRNKAAQEARSEAHIAGKFPLLRHQYNSVVGMKNAALEYVDRNTDFGLSLSDGKAEQTLIWDEETPFPKRGRLDWISNDKRTILDYKTTKRGLRFDEIRNHIESMGYDMQSEFYSKGVEKLTGKRPRFIFLFQEEFAPYMCQMFCLDAGFSHLAWAKVDYAERLWEQCLSTGQWPGYVDRILSLEPSPWAQARWDERMELETMTCEEN